MSQPYALFLDSRDSIVYRVAADGQSKVRVIDELALVADQFNLDQHGFDSTPFEASDPYVHAWLDSVPTH